MIQPKSCPCCQAPFELVELEGHYGNKVQVDLCAVCHLIWFDAFESVRLSGLGWVELLRKMMVCPRSTQVVPATLACIHCSRPLKAVRNLTRFGRTAAQECDRGHGQVQSFSLLLAERGLVRPINTRDHQALALDKRELTCLNCGAAGHHPAADNICLYCKSPLVMVDLPRLVSALLVRHAETVVVTDSARQLALGCRGCGQAIDPTRELRCSHCDLVVVLPSLTELRPLLDKIEPILRATRPRQALPHGSKLKRELGDHRATGWFRYLRRAKDIFFG